MSRTNAFAFSPAATSKHKLNGTKTSANQTIAPALRFPFSPAIMLKRDLNVICQDNDVLMNDDQGYHLNNEKITIAVEGDIDE